MDEKAENIINRNRILAINYINSSSIVVGLYCLEDHLIVIAETGKYIYKENAKMDYPKRVIKYYIINNMSNEIQIIATPFDKFNNNNLHSIYKNKLYQIIEKEGDDERFMLVELFK